MDNGDARRPRSVAVFCRVEIGVWPGRRVGRELSAWRSQRVSSSYPGPRVLSRASGAVSGAPTLCRLLLLVQYAVLKVAQIATTAKI